jgi:hypothetical protein
MPRSEADLIGKIDTIRGIIRSWDTLPINLTEFVDTQPFWGQAFLVKIGNQIKIRTYNAGDLDISVDDLMGRMGIGMDFLSMLENRLSIFKEIFDEVAMDPSNDAAYIREEVARERGDQELREISGWEGPSRERFGFIWTKSISRTILRIAYFRDNVTGEYVTRGLIIPFPPSPQWLIKDGRGFRLTNLS